MKSTCVRTKTGTQFFPLAPTPEMVDIEDIAHALSHQCRFAGHTSSFYSVAEHSVRVAMLVYERTFKSSETLSALLHDASEAYLVDLPTPLKNIMPDYREAERDVMAAVMQKFGLKNHDDVVMPADRDMLVAEARDLMGGTEWLNLKGETNPPTYTITPWLPEVAKEQFLAMFRGHSACQTVK